MTAYFFGVYKKNEKYNAILYSETYTFPPTHGSGNGVGVAISNALENLQSTSIGSTHLVNQLAEFKDRDLVDEAFNGKIKAIGIYEKGGSLILKGIR